MREQTLKQVQKQLMLMVLSVLLAGVVVAADYYVTVDGVDTADGMSWDTAWGSVSNAVLLAEADSTINISNGVYNCAGEILIDKVLTLVGVNGAAETTVRRDGTGGNHRVFRLTAAGIILDGLTIRDGTYAGQSSDNHSGGGVHMSVAATIRNCIFRENKVAGNALKGGAIHMTAGLVENCEFYGNEAHSQGGAINLSGNSVVRNCIMTGNTSGNTGGGAVFLTGSGTLVENCLIVGNNAGGTVVVSANGSFGRFRYDNRGGGIYNSGGVVRNCTILGNRSGSKGYGNPGCGLYQTGASAQTINSIIYYNGTSLYAVDRDDVVLAGGTITSSCAGAPLPGDGNTILDPDFMDWENGNYYLRPGSPCLDAGNDIPEMTIDLVGNERRIDGNGDGIARQDMGAFETEAGDTGTLRVNAVADINEGFDSLKVCLTGYAAGDDTATLTYYWDLDNDGETDVIAPQVTHTYGPGLHPVSLAVSNGTIGVSLVKSAYVRVAPSVVYVSTDGANVFPYATTENAANGTATAFADAIAATRVSSEAASRIEVAPGDYPLAAHIALDKAVTMRGTGGAAQTVLRRAANGSSAPVHRVLNVLFTGAVVDGFTIRNGYINYHQSAGGGVLVLSGGMLQNCIVTANWVNHKESIGGGGVLIFNGGTVRNCLIAQNDNYRYGGGVAAIDAPANARFENCTIVGNRVLNAEWYGGGTYAGTYLNCIIAGNINTGGDVAYVDRYGGTYTYTLSPGLSTGEGNIDDTPTFIDNDGSNYRLTSTSPGVNAGLLQLWMEGATDLAGAPRIVGRHVDLGAYECQALPGTVLLVR